jgi:hypothetical protein
MDVPPALRTANGLHTSSNMDAEKMTNPAEEYDESITKAASI